MLDWGQQPTLGDSAESCKPQASNQRKQWVVTMSKPLTLHDGTGVIARDPVQGVLLAYGTAVPALNAVGFAPGCRYVKTDAASLGTIEFINVGTRAAANFVQTALNGPIAVSFAYNAPDDQPIFVADRAYTVVSIVGRVLVAGTGGFVDAPRERQCRVVRPCIRDRSTLLAP